MNRKTLIRAHLIYWSIYIVLTFFAYTFPYYDPLGNHLWVYWLGTVLGYVVSILEFYFYYKIVIPRFLLLKCSPIKFLFISFCIMVVGMCARAVIWNLYAFLYQEIPVEAIHGHFFSLLQVAVFYPSITIVVKVVEAWITSEYEKNQLKDLTIESKVKFLKTQINPHFIFNTLNNIYSLSLKNREKAGVGLEKLQSTFKYLKKVETSSVVSIQETEEYISSYIELSKMRLLHPEKVNYSFERESNNLHIYPMLLVPFIENAFKHSNPVKDHDYITIQVKCKEEYISIEVCNTIPEGIKSKDQESGIGLKNVKERLQLLFSKDQFQMDITQNETEFVSKLKMPYAIV